MNIDKINNSIININNIQNKNIKFKEGDILTGYIKDLKDNSYIIDIEDKITINADKDKIIGNVGDTIYFKVVDDNNTLKQIVETEDEKNINEITEDISIQSEENKPKNRVKRSLDDFVEINKVQQQYKKYLDKNSQPSVQENILYTNKVKNKLSHISNTITKEDLQKFANSGVNPKNLDMMSFSDYLNDSLGVDTEKNTLDEKTLKEIKEEKAKSMKMDLNMNGVDEEKMFRFEAFLSEMGLPAIEKNISTLKNVKEKVESIENLDKETALNVIKNSNKTTIEDLYTSKYKKVSNMSNINIDNIENLDSQIENVLTQNNIEVNDENINIAKDFIKNEIDVTNNNIEKFKKLQNLKENAD